MVFRENHQVRVSTRKKGEKEFVVANEELWAGAQSVRKFQPASVATLPMELCYTKPIGRMENPQ